VFYPAEFHLIHCFLCTWWLCWEQWSKDTPRIRRVLDQHI